MVLKHIFDISVLLFLIIYRLGSNYVIHLVLFSSLFSHEQGKRRKDGQSHMLGGRGGWILREALGWQVGAAFCRSWFHLWVLIWEGPVCVCVWGWGGDGESCWRSWWAVRNHLDRACTVDHTRSHSCHSWMLIRVYWDFNYFLLRCCRCLWFESHRSSLFTRVRCAVFNIDGKIFLAREQLPVSCSYQLVELKNITPPLKNLRKKGMLATSVYFYCSR